MTWAMKAFDIGCCFLPLGTAVERLAARRLRLGMYHEDAASYQRFFVHAKDFFAPGRGNGFLNRRLLVRPAGAAPHSRKAEVTDADFGIIRPSAAGTETISPRFRDLHRWPGGEILLAMWEGQLAAVAAVRAALPALESAAEAALPRLLAGGRLVYAGAGTSGRIGVQDGAELPPTFDWPEDRLVLLMAGGAAAFTRSIENAEDDCAAAERDVAAHAIGPNDVVIGIAARERRRTRPRSSPSGGAWGAHHRHRQQFWRRAVGRGGAFCARRDGLRNDRRLDADEGGHGAEGGAEPVFDPPHGAARPHPSRPDGRYERVQRQAAPPRHTHAARTDRPRRRSIRAALDERAGA